MQAAQQASVSASAAPVASAAVVPLAATAPHQQQPTAGPQPTQSFTLFCGQIPNDVNEETLKQLFSAYGLVTECKILMDKVANKPRGCGFISFGDKLGAETAIATLHDRFKLPGSARPLIVRYSTKQLAADKSDPGPFKLYISNLSKQTNEEEIRTMFSAYGQLIDDVVILKDQMSNISRGVAFVRFQKRSEAASAIAALHEQIRDKDAANLMQVKFAHTASEKKQLLQKQMGGLAIGNGHMHGGPQMGGYYPAHYNPAYAAQPGFNPYAMPPHMAGYAQYGQMHGHPNAHPHPHGGHHHGHHGHRSQVTKGPEGANLFVYGIPEAYTDSDLSGMFANFGNVINAKVYRDLSTGKSKGFGFVSYDAVPPAQQACASMDGFLIAGKKMTVKPKSDQPTGQNQQQQGGQRGDHHVQQHQQQQQQHHHSHPQQQGQHPHNGMVHQQQQQQQHHAQHNHHNRQQQHQQQHPQQQAQQASPPPQAQAQPQAQQSSPQQPNQPGQRGFQSF